MITIILWLISSVCFSSPPPSFCSFGNENFMLTEDLISFTGYDTACQISGGEVVTLSSPLSEEHLIPWLEIRRGMRTCRAFKAFVRCEPPVKAAHDSDACCVVSPAGVEKYDICPQDLSLPALCKLLP